MALIGIDELIPSPAVPLSEAQTAPAIIPLRFWTEYKTLAGNPVEEDWVEWVKKGEQNGSRTQEAIKRLAPNPERGRKAAIEWVIIGPAYQAWKAGEEIPVTGTPLHAWSGVSRELANVLKQHRLYTIEDLADLPDHRKASIPIPSLRDICRKAKAWVEAKDTNDIGSRLAERDKVIDDQAALIADMQKRLEDQDNRINSMVVAGKQASQVISEASSEDDEFVQTSPDDIVSPPPRNRRR